MQRFFNLLFLFDKIRVALVFCLGVFDKFFAQIKKLAIFSGRGGKMTV
jgi:hypothetical protein